MPPVGPVSAEPRPPARGLGSWLPRPFRKGDARQAGAGTRDGSAAPTAIEAANVFVARQPVFTRGLQVHGYELLFRPSSSDSAFADIDANLASSRVISNGLCTLGWDALTGGRVAYINVTRDLLVGDQLRLLPASSTVIEIGTDTAGDPEVLRACARLRRAGYRLALDDFRWRTERVALLDAVDLVKVDVSRLGASGGDLGIRRLVARGLDVVAAKVETRAAFADAAELGCSHFQGYFFRKPVVIAGREAPGFVGVYQQILAETARSEVDYDRLEQLIKQDLSLSYKFLTYINAAAFGWKQRITSIKQALVLLGQEQVRRWVALITLAATVRGKPEELAVCAAVRARFCEALDHGRGLAGHRLDLFLLGMFSTIDAILDEPLSTAVERVPARQEVRAALRGAPGPLRDVLDLVVAYETGDWHGVDATARRLELDADALPSRYARAVAWADQVFGQWRAAA